MIEKIRSAGMNSPPTVRQTEIGVARSSPTGPHNQPQKIAEQSSAIGETPTRWPTTIGSTKPPMSWSLRTKSPNTASGAHQFGKTASARKVGSAALRIAPTYGTKRISPAITPHSSACGRPRRRRPRKISVPKPRFSSAKVRR